MRVLPDTCVWGKSKSSLIQADHDVEWAGDWPEDPGDLEILSRAHKEGSGTCVRSIPHSGIIRLVDISAHKQAEICLLCSSDTRT